MHSFVCMYSTEVQKTDEKKMGISSELLTGLNKTPLVFQKMYTTRQLRIDFLKYLPVSSDGKGNMGNVLTTSTIVY